MAALVAGALVAQAGLAAPAHAAITRYAVPGGSSANNCTSPATACSIDKAINQAATGDDVILAPGTYDVGGTGLSNSQANVRVHGVAGLPRPVINSTAAQALAMFGNGARVSDLTINHTGSLYGLNVFATSVLVERVEVRTSGAIGCTAGISGLARDLLCVTTATNGVALDDSWGSGSYVLVLRNVTAVATGPGSYGIRADSSGNDTNLDISARNVIAFGVAADIRSTEVGTNSESDVLLTNSNYDKIEEGGGGNVSNVGSVSSNQTALPVFADTTLFHQALGSPTIDKGGSDFGDRRQRPRRQPADDRLGRGHRCGRVRPHAPGRHLRPHPEAQDPQAQVLLHLPCQRERDVHLPRGQETGASVRLAVQGEVQEARQAHGHRRRHRPGRKCGPDPGDAHVEDQEEEKEEAAAGHRAA